MLAGELSCAPPGADLVAVGRSVLTELRGRDRWLLVFDNAEDPEELMPWLPGGAGHVLITSRAHTWAEVAVPVEIDVLARMESVAILRDRVPALSAQDADCVADAVGDLPLAVAQAAGFMADTGMLAKEYAALLAARAREILDQARPASYPQSLAALTQLALDRLRADDPAAAEVAALCAFLAPEPVPVDWFTRAAVGLPAPLAWKAADPGLGGRCWPGLDETGSPESMETGCGCIASPRPSSASTYPPVTPTASGHRLRRSWLPAIQAIRTTPPHGRDGRGCSPTWSPSISPPRATRTCAILPVTQPGT